MFTAVQRAGELMVGDEYRGAAEALESAVRQEPGMPQALLMLGACYTELGRRKDAKAQFDQVLKSDPQSVQALIGMANVLLEDGQTEDVVALCKRTLSLDARNTQAYALLGDVYIGQQQPEKALPYLEKAVEIQPKITQNRLNLAACLIDVKQLTRAEATLQEILSAHPRFPGAQFNLGVLYEELLRPEDARAAYLAEVANHPNSFKAHFNLGKVLAGLGDWEGSTAQMREVVRIVPKRPEGYLFLARALLQQSAPLDDVQRLAEEGLALAKAPDLKALGWFVMADVFNRKHQPDKVNAALAERADAALLTERRFSRCHAPELTSTLARTRAARGPRRRCDHESLSLAGAVPARGVCRRAAAGRVADHSCGYDFECASTASFVPNQALGAGIDRLGATAVEKLFTRPAIDRVLAAGWQTVSYRQNTELHVEAWHWNPQGTWSDPGGKGYFTGSASPGEPIEHSYGYPLPHRGVTRNDGTDANGYSRLTDGDLATYWKSNPYLTTAFTGEDDSLHPQWVTLDLANSPPVNAVRIAWSEPFARRYAVQYLDRREIRSSSRREARG